ncbi:Scd6-like Sm domain-containing protein [Mycena floridula]|nr:Scd6-like Sm domain-containing protein [Mycena floridula]
MALSFIGRQISLISQSDVRYRGTLAGISAENSTIQLSNVYSMGTENRRPTLQFIPPVQEPYEFIIFRASEVKDLAVDDTPAPTTRSVHDDPAASTRPVTVPASNPILQAQPPAVQPIISQPRNAQIPGNQRQSRRNNSVNTAMESVERALGDLRVGNTASSTNPGPRGGGARRNGASQNKDTTIKVPTTDFDFEQSNARFDKSSLKKEDQEDSADADSEKSKQKVHYDPKSSFFDALTSGPPRQPANGTGNSRAARRGGRRGGFGRSRRDEEREKNVATFGEAGGIGLLGPGAYVHGYDRGRPGRGRGRGRRPPRAVEPA